MDRITPEARRRNMRAVKNENTEPEVAVRKSLRLMGCGYRLHGQGLPGRPDIVMAGRKAAIFVHGCFWHQHHGCPKAKPPKTRVEFWDRKLANNVLRDQRNLQKLEALGWASLVIWECETRDPSRLTRLLTEFLGNLDMGGRRKAASLDQEI
jgi:DNA mismatch endonuclease (patch repair protein)